MTGDARIRIETDLGAIDIAVHVDRAPATAAYVRALIDRSQFADATFYRSTTLRQPDRRPLIQGGPFSSFVVGSADTLPPIEMLEHIDTTDDTGLRHQAGTVSLARDLGRTGHVLPELFVCLDDYPELDAGGRSEPDELGFPAFGTVVAGMNVVEAIAALDTGGATSVGRLIGDVLTHPVRISSTSYAPSGNRPPTESTD